MTAAGLLAGLAGFAGVLAFRDILAGRSRAGDWLRQAVEPLVRAGLEGYLPDAGERLRLAALVGLVAGVVTWWVAGPLAGLVPVVAAPLATAFVITRSRQRFRLAIERALPGACRAVADCLTAGYSVRGALEAAVASLEGPARNEFDQLRFALVAGIPVEDALRTMADRLRSRRIDAFATALVSQRLAGGDLAALLRRFADSAAERDRVVRDARSATAQARFTGYLVAAMPLGAAAFMELLHGGFLASILRSPAALLIAGLSVSLQAVGFLAISRLSRIGVS